MWFIFIDIDMRIHGLRSLAKAKLSGLFENILNICKRNGFFVTS